jgi:hypothetical protein
MKCLERPLNLEMVWAFFSSYPQVYNNYMKNFIYTYVCPECESELEFKSMNKASDEAMCMCGLQMKLIRYWAKSA